MTNDQCCLGFRSWSGLSLTYFTERLDVMEQRPAVSDDGKEFGPNGFCRAERLQCREAQRIARRADWTRRGWRFRHFPWARRLSTISKKNVKGGCDKLRSWSVRGYIKLCQTPGVPGGTAVQTGENQTCLNSFRADGMLLSATPVTKATLLADAATITADAKAAKAELKVFAAGVAADTKVIQADLKGGPKTNLPLLKALKIDEVKTKATITKDLNVLLNPGVLLAGATAAGIAGLTRPPRRSWRRSRGHRGPPDRHRRPAGHAPGRSPR